jgi:hypothetical protein
MKQTQKIFLSLLMMLMALTASAQETAFGIKGGINLSTLNLNDAESSYDSRTGFHAGIFMRARTGNIGFQPEVLLLTQNGEITSSAFGTAQERFTYLSIPLMLKFYPIGGFNFQVGPQFGFLLAGERKYDTFVGTGSKDITDYYKSSDVSVSLGLGYDFGFGLGLDARYNLGVKDINNASNGDPVKSRVFLLSLGWNFLK